MEPTGECSVDTKQSDEYNFLLQPGRQDYFLGETNILSKFFECVSTQCPLFEGLVHLCGLVAFHFRTSGGVQIGGTESPPFFLRPIIYTINRPGSYRNQFIPIFCF